MQNPQFYYPATYQNPYNSMCSQYAIAQSQPQQIQPQQNMMPVIQTSIIQVNDVDDVDKYQIANGQSQMFISKDDSKIYIKSATANGTAVEVYAKQPAPKPPEYVTVDQLKAMFKELGLTKEATNEPV